MIKWLNKHDATIIMTSLLLSSELFERGMIDKKTVTITQEDVEGVIEKLMMNSQEKSE